MFRAVLLTLCLILQAPSALAETVRVAAAVSLKDALTAIVRGYEAETGDKLEISFGASGQLATQIKSGAPIDLFISASQKQMDELATSGHADPSSVRVVAGNSLVLIAPADAKETPSSFESLARLQGRIAIGEPVSVPAGEYAMQVLASLKLTDALHGKLVFGTNVRQVLAYVERSEVSAGVVYATDALQSGDKVRVVARADPRWHKPIVYPAVVLKDAANAATASRYAAASRFLDYLQTDPARAVLTSSGFTVPSAPATQPAK